MWVCPLSASEVPRSNHVLLGAKKQSSSLICACDQKTNVCCYLCCDWLIVSKIRKDGCQHHIKLLFRHF